MKAKNGQRQKTNESVSRFLSLFLEFVNKIFPAIINFLNTFLCAVNV